MDKILTRSMKNAWHLVKKIQLYSQGRTLFILMRRINASAIKDLHSELA